MTVVAHPLDAVSGSPQFTSQQIRQTGSVLHGAGSGTPLGARDGLRVGASNVLTVSGSTWRVSPCAGVLDTGLTVNGDPYEWAVTAQESGAIAAADASNPRIDVVYLRIADNAVDSAGAASAFVEYRAGVPASSPVRPTLMADGATPLTQGLILGTINVPASGGGNPVAAPVNQYVVAAGGILPCAEADLAGLAKYRGLTVRTETRLAVWNGAAWDSYWPSAAPIIQAPLIQRGSNVITTDGGGGFGVIFPTPFAAAPTVIANSGDYRFANTVGLLAPTGSQRVPDRFFGVAGNPNATPNAGVRIDWIAVGDRP